MSVEQRAAQGGEGERAIAPDESTAWVISDERGVILDVSPDGGRLLNGTVRGLQQRNLIMFFEQDRDGWRGALVRACSGEHVVHSGRLRPKERRPIPVTVAIARATDWPGVAVRWAFER